MQQLNNDFFAELKDFNAQYGGKWSEAEEKSLYKQFFDMSLYSDRSAYDHFLQFRLAILSSRKEMEFLEITQRLRKLDTGLNSHSQEWPKYSGYDGKSNHNQARALAAKAKQKKRLAKKRKK